MMKSCYGRLLLAGEMHDANLGLFFIELIGVYWWALNGVRCAFFEGMGDLAEAGFVAVAANELQTDG